MSDGKMDPVQGKDAVMSEKLALSPGFILFRQGLVEATRCHGAGGNSHQGVSNFPHVMRAHSFHKHLGERFGRLWFLPAGALKYLAVKRAFPISGPTEIGKAPCGSDQITGVRTIAG